MNDRTYRRDRTYSGHTQDLAYLIDQAGELGASSIRIVHASGTVVTVRWHRPVVSS